VLKKGKSNATLLLFQASNLKKPERNPERKEGITSRCLKTIHAKGNKRKIFDGEGNILTLTKQKGKENLKFSEEEEYIEGRHRRVNNKGKG